MSPQWLRYAGLASWLSQTASGGLACGLERDPTWYVLFTLFATYTLLPLPLLWAMCAGSLTSALELLKGDHPSLQQITLLLSTVV